MTSELGPFDSVLPIRCRGAFHLYAARSAVDGAPRLVVTAAPTAERVAARACLDRFAEAHRALAGDALPAVREAGVHEGVGYVALDCDPVADGEAVIQVLGETKTRVSYPAAAVLSDRLGRTLERAHTFAGPGGPHAFGGLAWANVVIDRAGEIWMIGLGHNVVGRDERGVLSGAPSFFVAPELAAGGAPTPSSDAWAFVMLQRSVLAYCELPEALRRVFDGSPRPEDAAIQEIVGWSTERVVAAPPRARATLTELRARWEREWELLGLRPDRAALASRLRALRSIDDAPELEPERRTERGALTVAADGSWVCAPSGERYALTGRGPLKRVLMRLVDAHRRDGARVVTDQLLEAGWPGERPLREAGLNRVYVAIATLRKMGLRDVLARDDQGYCIDPRVTVRVEE